MTHIHLTESDLKKLHRAGIGGYRPMGDKVIAHADALVAAGLLGRNEQTGIYFLTAAGNERLAGTKRAPR